MGKQKPCKYLETEWIWQMTESLARMHPEMDRDTIEDFVIEQYHNRYTNHSAMLHNSYENTTTETSLGEVVDWAESYHPLMAESGVFFYPKDKKRNVNIEIIKEAMLDARTVHKKEKFEAMKRGDTFTAAVKDLQQGNDKKAANSGYGAEGQSSSFLFNVNSAMSVTASGRGQLSTMILNFENLFADNVKFWNMDEFHTYINHVVNDRKSWKFNTDNVINITPTRKQWVERFCDKVIHETLCDQTQIEATYDGLTDEDRVRTFYMSNMRAFLLNRVPMELFQRIADTDVFLNKDGNPVPFANPNEVPKEIEETMDKLSSMVAEFVNYKFSNFRYQDKARYSKRRFIILSDTDSAFNYFGEILQFVLTNVLNYRLFKKKKDAAEYRLKIVNTLAVFAGTSLPKTLWNYTGYVNVAEEDRGHIKAKNEFALSKILITYAKKSYLSWQTRQESVVFEHGKLDAKGVSFFKSTSTENTTNFIYDDILRDQIFEPADGKVSLKRIYKTIADYQAKITKEISEGNMGYMKRSIKVKSPDAYTDPMRINAYKSTYVWNKLNDDKDRIDLPATVTIAKVTLKTKKDCAALAPWPKIYNRVIELFEKDPNIGDHEETYVKNGETKTRMVKGKGINSIAIPGDLDDMPEWVLPILDVATLVKENLALMDQIMKPLGFHGGKVNVNGTTAKFYTSHIRI